MKFLGTAVLCAFAWVVAVNGQQLSIANLTTCGLECLLMTVPEANCSLTDTTCQCKSTTLPALTSACLLKNCTMHDQLIVAKVQASICDLDHENRSNTLIGVAAAVFVTTTAIIILRTVSKGFISNTIGAEDWIIVLALLLSLPSTYFTITIAKEGFGKHIWDLNDGSLAEILENFYIAENIYVVDLALTKLSILVFYLRIFPQMQFRYVAFATIGVITMSTTIILFMTIFSCHPVPFFWNKDIRGGTCININALAYANSAMSIIQDLIIVALPLPLLVKMKLGSKKKIGVVFMFAIGSFGCVVSMIRLKALLAFGNSLDPTWDYVDTVIWTILELAVAMTCACLPAIRNILTWLYPKTFLSTVRSTRTGNTAAKLHNSHAGLRRPGHNLAGNFVELQESGSSDSKDAPPAVPPKGMAVSMERDRSVDRV